MSETCAICGCRLHRTKGAYAQPTPEGRSHASKHHCVPERFFGRSTNRKGTQRQKIFEVCPWGQEGKTVVFCYDCHEELLHNPVFLPRDVERFALLAESRGLAESKKSESKEEIAGRIRLLHEVVEKGLDVLLRDVSKTS